MPILTNKVPINRTTDTTLGRLNTGKRQLARDLYHVTRLLARVPFPDRTDT